MVGSGTEACPAAAATSAGASPAGWPSGPPPGLGSTGRRRLRCRRRGAAAAHLLGPLGAPTDGGLGAGAAAGRHALAVDALEGGVELAAGRARTGTSSAARTPGLEDIEVVLSEVEYRMPGDIEVLDLDAFRVIAGARLTGDGVPLTADRDELEYLAGFALASPGSRPRPLPPLGPITYRERRRGGVARGDRGGDGSLVHPCG
jgi:hypothetical protein